MSSVLNIFQDVYHIVILHFVALIAPGNDFSLILRNSIIYSRKSALLTSFGISVGIFIHVLLGLTGISWLIKHNDILYSILKIICGCYLIYLGTSNFKPVKRTREGDVAELNNPRSINNWNAFLMGFFTNIFNPKVIVFFVSLFSTLVSGDLQKSKFIFFLVQMPFTAFTWFAFLTLLFTYEKSRSFIIRYKGILLKITGIILISGGLKVITL